MVTESELWEWMMEDPSRRALATLSRDRGNLKAGTRVKVIMVSRMGDVGVTSNLNSDQGYEARISCIHFEVTVAGKPCLLLPENILQDIVRIDHGRPIC